MSLFIFIVSPFWFIVVLDKILFWIWLWQLKEYRLDRFLAHFELPSSRKIFFNKLYLAKLILFFSSLIFFVLQNQNLNFLGATLISVFYIGLGLLTIIKILKRRLRTPLLTKKAILVIFLNFLTILAIIYLSHLFSIKNFILFFSGLLAVDIFMPAIVSFLIGLFRFPTNFFKGRIIKKAKEKRARLKDLLVIGITGSYGKTSIKEILAHILAKKFKVLKTEANQNTEIGVAKAVLEKLRPEHQIFVVEMAAYKIGEIRKICDIVQPKIGILTAIGSQHLSLFGSQENIIKGKYELIESLPDRGLAVFNGDNEYCRKLYEQTKNPKRVYSIANSRESENERVYSIANSRESANSFPDITITAKDIRAFKEGLEFTVFAENKEQNFRTKLVGIQNVSNILAAVLTAKELGMSLQEISKAVAEIKPFSHTLEIKKGINDTILIDDSYSANFEGVMAALNYISLYEESKKVMIFYPMIELGKMAKEIHKKVGEKIGKVCDLLILTSPDFSKEIIDGAVFTGMNPKNILISEKPISVINKVKSFVKKGDVVLVENRVSKEILKGLVFP